VPLVEELAFRGYLMRRLVAADFERVRPEAVTWASCLLSSLAFGLLHRSWPAGAAAGMIFALAYRRRGRLFDAVLAHSVTNGLVVIFALAAGDRQLWG
jgi:CAAX prenyl protease-like protein